MSCSRREVIRIGPSLRDGAPAAQDWVAVEEPLEIRIAGEPVAVTMRTPGSGEDQRLAIGFLYGEGILTSIDDIGTLAHCGRPGTEGFGNVLDVLPGPGVSLDIDRVQSSRRGTLTTASCGVCGRRSIADLIERCGEVPPGPLIPRDLLLSAVERLPQEQPTFSRTGGTHAAAALLADGTVLCVHEDVGRHNAVDKVVGALLLSRRIGRSAACGPAPALLLISGRASFEIVQKAAVAGIPVIASVSAASSLAVDLARRCGITLAAFVRGGSLALYAHPERIVSAEAS